MSICQEAGPLQQERFMKLSIQWFQNIGPNYLWRLRLIPVVILNGRKFTPPFNAFLHVFLRSDHDRALHDHPWASTSINIWGKCREIYMHDTPRVFVERCRTIPWLKPVHRPASWRHMMILDSKFAVTLFFVGFKVREWGFWPNNIFVHYKDYLK